MDDAYAHAMQVRNASLILWCYKRPQCQEIDNVPDEGVEEAHDKTSPHAPLAYPLAT